MSRVELLYPYALLLIPLYLLFVWFVKRYYRRVAFSNLKLLKKALQKSFDSAKILRFFIVTSIAFALATPAIEQTHKEKVQEGYDISLLLDASNSMREENRFKIAKEIVSHFIKERKNDNIALTLFANYAYVASPLTHEKESLQKMLRFIKLGVAGSRETALYEALFLGADLFKKSSRKNRVMILLTDGINTVKSVSLQSALKRIKKANIRLYTIALGKNGDYNKVVLEKIAKNSGGEFYTALKPQELALIYNKINQLEQAKIEGKSIHSYRYYIHYPLIVALVLLLLYGYLYRGSYAPIPYALAIALLLYATIKPTTLAKTPLSAQKGEFTIALDMSYAMEAKDIYPSRFKFAKAKIIALLKHLKGERVALYAYAKEPYLVSPATNDYERLIYLVKNLEPIGIERGSSSLIKLLEAIDKNEHSKGVLLVSATDAKSFKQEKRFLQVHPLQLSIYAVATLKGDIVKVDGRVLKEGNAIRVFRLNSAIKDLATISGGAYQVATPSNSLETLVKSIRMESATALQERGKEEAQLLPIVFALLLFLFALLNPNFALEIHK